MSKRPSKPFYEITVAARDSALSKAQVEEVFQQLLVFEPQVKFSPYFTKTVGDRDRTTSLRTLGKTDFFTKEIDELVSNRTCRIAIHSAKDLPDPLPKDLVCVAITKGVDPSDSLVLRDGELFETLPARGRIAASSFRREEIVKELREDLTFVDIRGTIEERLAKLFSKEVDGVVIAEAALIRLKLTHLNRIHLQGETAPLQGRLAIVARKEDQEMKSLFTFIDFQKD